MMRWHLAYRPRHYVLWAIEERAAKKSDGRGAIGMINYHRRDLREKRVDVGWLMLPAYQGKGYAAEAGRALLKYLIERSRHPQGRGADRAGKQAVGRARQAPGISPGGRADPRPLVRLRPLA